MKHADYRGKTITERKPLGFYAVPEFFYTETEKKQ